MRFVRTFVSAMLMLTALSGCVELNRRSATRASMLSASGFETVPGHESWVGRGDDFRHVGPVDPFHLVMRSADLLVSVGFDPSRSGPTLIGPILPLIPVRLRRPPVDTGVPLRMTIAVIRAGGPVTLDLSKVRVRLPDGRELSPICDPKVAGYREACVIRTSPLSGTDRYSTSVTLPLPVDGYAHPSLVIDLPAVEVDGRRIILPQVTARYITKWLLGMAHA
jgi:hypothetical protein